MRWRIRRFLRFLLVLFTAATVAFLMLRSRYREVIREGDRDTLIEKLNQSSARKRQMNRREEACGAVGRERGTDAFADRA